MFFCKTPADDLKRKIHRNLSQEFDPTLSVGS